MEVCTPCINTRIHCNRASCITVSFLFFYLFCPGRLSVRRQPTDRKASQGTAPSKARTTVMLKHKALSSARRCCSATPVWTALCLSPCFFAGDKDGRRTKCRERAERLREQSAQWGHRARWVGRWRGWWGAGLLVRAGRGNGARTCGQWERGWLQPPHCFLVPEAPHDSRLHPQQPRLIPVVSETQPQHSSCVGWWWASHRKQRLFLLWASAGSGEDLFTD